MFLKVVTHTVPVCSREKCISSSRVKHGKLSMVTIFIIQHILLINR